MKEIQFLAASDRLNYGDLLFPIITKMILEKHTDSSFSNYALIKSNLSSFGALPTDGYKKLEEDNNDTSIIVVGGGHVMFPSWSTLYGHISKIYLRTKKLYFLNFLYKYLNIPSRFFTKSKTPSPFAPYQLKGKLVYLSVGGNYNDHRLNGNIKTMLANTTILSVRDNMLYKQLKGAGFSVTKIPDTATIISKLFPREMLKMKLSANFTFTVNQKYIVVQLGLHKGPIDPKKFVANINLLKEKGYQILCMPIGLAADHEDYKVLDSLLKLDTSWSYYLPKNIYEIMYLISNASFFFGTSLHGCITAFAYNTPFVPLNKKVKKLNNYTKTWWSPFLKESIDYENLNYFINSKLENWDSAKARQLLSEQQKLVMQNYDNLIAL